MIKPLLIYPHLTARQIAVMIVIKDKKMMVRDIANAMQVPRPSISRAFDTLEQYGLVKRQKSYVDCRDVFGLLTEKGIAFVKSLGSIFGFQGQSKV